MVPKSVAADVDDLEFTPAPDAVLERDPVVRFDVTALQPGGSTSWEFVVRLAEAVQKEALPGLAADAEAARVSYEQAAAPGPSPTS